MRLRLNEPIDDDSLIFCRIEFQTVAAENLKALRPTALVVRRKCKRLSEDERDNTKNININITESMHGEMCPVRQNPIHRTVTTAHLSVLMTVHNFSTQYSTEQF